MGVLCSAAFVGLGGCFLVHDRAEEASAVSPGDPVLKPVDLARTSVDPPPKRGHDHCPVTPEDYERCPCGIRDSVPQPDASGNCFYCHECPADCEVSVDGDRFLQSRVSWQVPGGFTGWGPAIVVTGDGRVRVWHMTQEFAPANDPETTPDEEYRLEPLDVDQLIGRFRAADISRLPHEVVDQDCYPVIHVQECFECEATEIRYRGAEQVRPELDCFAE